MKNALRNALRRVAVAAGASLLTVAAASSAADAANLSGKFVIDVSVADNGGATGSLSDTLISSNSYTVALTATGGGSCSLVTPQVVVLDEATGSGNPVSISTSGACRLYNAEATYTFTWTGVLGTTGQVQVECVWTLGIKTCTNGHYEGDLPL